MFSKQDQIQGYDDALLAAMNAEEQRQEDHIELIASENYTSKRVMQAQGSGLTNKYAEGYPGKRYYGGCEHVDKVEQLAIDRAKQLFGADYANVQPHSGSQANAAVFLALLQAGDTVLGMSLAHGGHLTHGASVSSSGKLYNAIQYGIDANGLIDYDEVERLAVEHQPKMIIALGGTAAVGLLGEQGSVSSMRGRFHNLNGIPVRVTYHPSYLLRSDSPREKRKVWEDMLAVMERLDMPISEKQRGYFLPRE